VHNVDDKGRDCRNPLALKGKSTGEGIRYLSDIGLDALEVEFVRRVSMKEETALAVGEIARTAKIDLSVHAPYMINLASEDPKVILDSISRIKLSLDRAHALGHRLLYSIRPTILEVYQR